VAFEAQLLAKEAELEVAVQVCCCTVVTLLLHCCYTVVTLLLHCCYTVVTLLSHCCSTGTPPAVQAAKKASDVLRDAIDSRMKTALATWQASLEKPGKPPLLRTPRACLNY
jgi:hypothetical protein